MFSLVLILTLIMLLILVDFYIPVNMNIRHDANLGARSSRFITNTTSNTNCDTDISRNTSIYTSMDVSNTNAIQLTKCNYKYQYNTKTFTNMSTNISMKNSCQYNTKTFTNISINISTKSSNCIHMDTNKDIEKLYISLLTLMPILPLRLTSMLIDVYIKLVSTLSAATMLILTFGLP